MFVDRSEYVDQVIQHLTERWPEFSLEYPGFVSYFPDHGDDGLVSVTATLGWDQSDDEKLVLPFSFERYALTRPDLGPTVLEHASTDDECFSVPFTLTGDVADDAGRYRAVVVGVFAAHVATPLRSHVLTETDAPPRCVGCNAWVEEGERFEWDEEGDAMCSKCLAGERS